MATLRKRRRAINFTINKLIINHIALRKYLYTTFRSLELKLNSNSVYGSRTFYSALGAYKDSLVTSDLIKLTVITSARKFGKTTSLYYWNNFKFIRDYIKQNRRL